MHASTFGNAHSVTPWSRQGRVSVAFSAPTARRSVRRANGKRALPNKRLQLAGGDHCKGNGVLCTGAHELSLDLRELRLYATNDAGASWQSSAADSVRGGVRGLLVWSPPVSVERVLLATGQGIWQFTP